jgi:NAD-dependent SIR2 family protein deacetylase
MGNEIRLVKTAGTLEEHIETLRRALAEAETVVIGAGAGLSTAAGFVYSGERFEKYFNDFKEKYGFGDMYSGGFHVLQSPPEEMWAYWSRYIWINRYAPIPKDTYSRLHDLIKAKDYFVITTNVDHCFQRAGFDKRRLFYTQGDYGLFQSSDPQGITARKTYENEEIIREMIISQGFEPAEDGNLMIPEGKTVSMKIPSELIPYCPDDGMPFTFNLRSDDSFVEDEGWHEASRRYSQFLESRRNTGTLYLELGVGYNTPVIIKYPFWQMTNKNPRAVYACLNRGEAYTPDVIAERSICINEDLNDVINALCEKERII